MIWAQTIVNGLLLGGLYGLFGLGLAFSFGIIRLVNVAHGEFIVLAAYLGASLLSLVPVSAFVVILPVCAAMFAIGWTLQSALLNDRRQGADTADADHLRLVDRHPQFAGSDLHCGRARDPCRRHRTEGLDHRRPDSGGVPADRLFADFDRVSDAAIHHLENHGGPVLRATADDREIVQTFGVNYRQVYNVALGLAVALSALAGLLLAMRSSFSPFAGQDRLLISFEVVIVGGLGSFWGALWAAWLSASPRWSVSR